ncbi:MAG: hypothetical protein ACREQF_01285, partial [Candidatus Binataceae bacterium]
ALGAAGVCAATLTVIDVEDPAHNPLSNHTELSFEMVTVGQDHCGGKTLMLVNRGDRSIAIELRISGRGFERLEYGGDVLVGQHKAWGAFLWSRVRRVA